MANSIDAAVAARDQLRGAVLAQMVMVSDGALGDAGACMLLLRCYALAVFVSFPSSVMLVLPVIIWYC